MARRIPTMKKKHLLQRPMTRRKAARRRETETRIPSRRRLICANTVRRRVTLRPTASRRIHQKYPKSSQRRETQRLRRHERQLRKNIFCRLLMWNANRTMTKESCALI